MENSEKERLEALYAYKVLDSEEEIQFDNIVQLASQICGTPVSLISLIDLNRQWFKSRVGFPASETSRSVSFCAHAIHQEGVMIIPDATKDARFADNPLVTGSPNIRFYAGAPLISQSGHALGTLCVIDQKPGNLSPEQQFALTTLAQQVMSQLELRAKVNQLNELVMHKDRILSIISHDVRGPIKNVLQLLELYLVGQVPQKDLPYLAREMHTTLNSADNLLARLLDWFMAQLEQPGIRYTSVDLSKLLNEIVEETSSLLTSKENELIQEVAPGLLLEGDEEMLRFVIRNLLLNANKFTQCGQIRLLARQTGGMLHISVKDTGVGIKQDRLQQLFNWDRLKSTPGTAKEKGHGLGLVLSKEFIDKHSGTISINSMPGEGTEVTVKLPKSILEVAYSSAS